MLDNKRKSIYKHTDLSEGMVARLRPLMESAFANELNASTPQRKKIADEKLNFATRQYANRVRISENLGTTPLFEDSKIFGTVLEGSKQLFESVSTPGNVIGMGDVTNPGSSSTQAGGLWNPSYKAGSGDIPSYVFGLQTQLALHCIGFELMPTIAVDTPKVVINYVDDVYGGGAFDDVSNMPSFVDVYNKVFTANWLNAADIKRATTKMVLQNADGTKAMQVLFMVGSNLGTAVTVQVLSTGTVTTDVYTADNSVSVKDVVDSMGTTGKLIYTKVAGGGVTTVSLTNLTKVNFSSAIRNPINEAATNNMSRTGMTRKQHEKGPKHKLNVVSMDKQVEMVGFEFEADTTNIQIRDFAAQGVNVIARLYNGVQNQLIQNLDNVILDHLYALGFEHAYNAKMSQNIDHSIYIASPSKADIAYTAIKVPGFEMMNMMGEDIRTEMGTIVNSMQSSAYENQMTHAERLYSRILLVAEFIGQQNRIAPADQMVLGGALAATVKKQATYQARPTANTLAANPELHYSGTIFETISVYKNPKSNFNDPRVWMGRRGDDTDPGAKFLAYDLAASRQTIAEQTMAEKIRVWSRYQIVDVGFYPELNYYSFVAINEFGWS